MQGISLCKTYILVSFAHCLRNETEILTLLRLIGNPEWKTNKLRFLVLSSKIRNNREYQSNVKVNEETMIEKLACVCESLHLSVQMEIAMNTNVEFLSRFTQLWTGPHRNTQRKPDIRYRITLYDNLLGILLLSTYFVEAKHYAKIHLGGRALPLGPNKRGQSAPAKHFIISVSATEQCARHRAQN